MWPEQNRKLIIVGGLPCSGKSSVTRILAIELNAQIFDIENAWNKHLSTPKYTQKESNYVFNKFIEEIFDSFDFCDVVIAEGVFASKERIDRIKQQALLKEIQTFFILFYCDIDTIKKRIHERKKSRKGKEITDSNLLMLINKFNSTVSFDLNINTSILSPQQITNKIMKYLY